MSNVEAHPSELTCQAGPADGRRVEILPAREVPLGGPRAMTVRRTLPHRDRPMIGAWCFADHYGPNDVRVHGGMNVPPHPHTGLQTVSWLFSGEVEHRDGLGSHALVRPGELNLMTGGSGICHSEVSTPATTWLHGVQLWVALPDAHRNTGREFQHYVPPAVELGGATARVFLGTLQLAQPIEAPVATFSPLLGAELTLDPYAKLTLPTRPDFEHGVLVDLGPVMVAGVEVAPSEIGFSPAGAASIELTNPSGQPARVLLLGGTPFEEEIVMWWNFVARNHDEVVAAREDWERESDRFGQVEGYTEGPRRLPAPTLPNARIKPRKRP